MRGSTAVVDWSEFLRRAVCPYICICARLTCGLCGMKRVAQEIVPDALLEPFVGQTVYCPTLQKNEMLC